MRLIIHLDDCEDKQAALLRVYNGLPEYYRLKGEDDRRLTVRFEDKAMIFYHDRSDVVIFTQSTKNSLLIPDSTP